jgi:hypothetical protein
MAVEMLERTCGHHHPDYQNEAAEAVSGQKLPEQTSINLNELNENHRIYKGRPMSHNGTRGSWVQILPLRSIISVAYQAAAPTPGHVA